MSNKYISNALSPSVNIWLMTLCGAFHISSSAFTFLMDTFAFTCTDCIPSFPANVNSGSLDQGYLLQDSVRQHFGVQESMLSACLDSSSDLNFWFWCTPFCVHFVQGIYMSLCFYPQHFARQKSRIHAGPVNLVNSYPWIQARPGRNKNCDLRR